jgi:hypothetical protein
MNKKNKNRVLYVSTCDMGVRCGAGLAALAYYEAAKIIWGDMLDLAIPEESHKPMNTSGVCYTIPKRNKIMAIFALLFGNIHRYKNFLISFLNNNKDKYKIIIINNGINIGDTIDYIKFLNIDVIVIHHNYEKEYHVDNKTMQSFYGFCPYYICRNEKNAYKKADLNIFFTQSDKILFEQNYGKCNSFAEVGGIFEPDPSNIPIGKQNDLPAKYTLVITGSMNTYQTNCGIIDFYNNYYSIAQNIYPEINILLSGRNPSKNIYQIAENEKGVIEIVANPENIDNIINRGAIYCCPANIGGGLKLRIMDGLRQGLPVLVHKVSSRGYDAFFSKPYFKIYSNKESFRYGLTTLLELYNNNKIDNEQIQIDYKAYFGFEAGYNRFKDIVNCL